jgi:hypothetical protein
MNMKDSEDMINAERIILKTYGGSALSSGSYKKNLQQKWFRLRTCAKIRSLKRKWFDMN